MSKSMQVGRTLYAGIDIINSSLKMLNKVFVECRCENSNLACSDYLSRNEHICNSI